MHRIRLLARQLQSVSTPPAHRRTLATMPSVPETMKALQIHSQGGLDVLAMHDIAVPKPKEDELLVKVEYAGVNYIDTYQRSGLYPLQLPFVLGNEAAGTVVQVGSGGTTGDVSVGDLVTAYCAGGAFAQYAAIPRSRSYKVAGNVNAKLAAAATLQGLTGEWGGKEERTLSTLTVWCVSSAWTLVKEAYPIQKGDWVLVHAAAGGVGLLLCQMASHLGAHVIGTTSTAEKAQLAKENGAEHIVNYTSESIVDKVLELTGGKGVQGIYDGVGKDTWEGGCCRRLR